jgi:hypothetical protein
VAAERQWRSLDAAGQPSVFEVVVEPPQSVDVDGAVVDPDALQQAVDPQRLCHVERALIQDVEYVVHLPGPFTFERELLVASVFRC